MKCDKASDKASNKAWKDGARKKRQIDVTNVVIPKAVDSTRIIPQSRIVSPKYGLPIIYGHGFAKPILLNFGIGSRIRRPYHRDYCNSTALRGLLGIEDPAAKW